METYWLAVRDAVTVLLVGLLCLASVTLSQAAVMSSTNYQLESDSINTGGGLGTSTNYIQESTMGEIATGLSSSTNFVLKAGYQQRFDSYLSLSTIGDVTLLPNLGLAGGYSSGTATFVVITDAPAGYRATFEAAETPAMQSPVGTIGNYIPAGAAPDFTFAVGSTEARFGFSPEGPDIVTRFEDNGASCGVAGSDTVDACYDMVSTTPVEIVRSTSANHPSGATTTLRFRLGVGSQAAVSAGSYVATTTITAIAL
jgi:hypothetical protein